MTHIIEMNDLSIGGGSALTLIAGPCVIEDYQTTLTIASELKQMTARLGMPFVFKASYDKANRTAISSYRGPGIGDGLTILKKIKQELGIMIISDVHHAGEVEAAAAVLDIIQIPALLCRQTDLLVAAGRTGLPVNIKKGQFLAPWDMANAVEKVRSTGNRSVMITERGNMHGYNNLVVDFRGIKIMQDAGTPVIFDATHSVQLPGGSGNKSSGQREFAPLLASAAVAAGADGIFLEVHPDPDNALCDGPNSLQLETVPQLLKRLNNIKSAVSS